MWVKDFVIYIDAICNIVTLIPSGPVAFPTDIDDISFLTYSSVNRLGIFKSVIELPSPLCA